MPERSRKRPTDPNQLDRQIVEPCRRREPPLRLLQLRSRPQDAWHDAGRGRGRCDHVWKLDELIGVLEAAERTATKRGPYKEARGLGGFGEIRPLSLVRSEASC